MTQPEMAHPEKPPCPLAHSDAAYVLGSLSPADRLEFERHLPGCERCRRSVAELAGLPGLLSRVSREQVEAPLPFEPLPETVLPALVAAVRREQRRKGILVSLGAAAAVAVVALGVGALQGGRDDGREPVAVPPASSRTTSASPAPKVPMQVVRDYGVHAEVSLVAKGWGTALTMDCRYDARDEDYGSNHAYAFRLVVFTEDGAHQTSMSWHAKPGDSIIGLSGTSAAEPDEITKVELQGEDGHAILRLDL
jgi:Putative zinc-finger